MTYARQQEVFQKECGEISPAAEPGLAINGEGLLTDRSLARGSKLGDLLMSQSLELQQRDIALGGRQTPLVELAVDGRAEPLQHVSSLATPALSLGPGLDQLTVQPLRSRPRGRELPAVNRDPRQCE